ncbi:MAG TPA: AmmeMemoRadiSam system protein A [Blastocatellia bacterium]
MNLPLNIRPQDLARLAVENYVQEHVTLAPLEHFTGVLAERAGAFVTLREKTGALRGCIGTIQPTCSNVACEIIQNAISAATRDPRFREVSSQELPDLVYGVDLLSEPEIINTMQDLDPSRFGLIVETPDGRRGLLLPDIAGIETPEQQWKAVHTKAGIAVGDQVRAERFTVRRFGKD